MEKAKILVIDDTDAVREVLTRQLEALGTDVTSLADGHQVKRVLSETHYDLVIADLHLPDCSGVDIARFAHAKSCKIVLLSGDNVALSRPHLRHSGFDDILMKPVSMDDLQDLLARFGLNKAQEQNQTPSQLFRPANQLATEEYDTTGAINLAVLSEQMGELDESCLLMLNRFPDMMRPLVTTLTEAARKNDFSLIEETAHSLKGAARSIGALPFGDLLEDIQTLARSKSLKDTTLDSVRNEFAKLETAIRQLEQ